MNYNEATKYLANNSGSCLEMVDRNPTRTGYVFTTVWLEGGEIWQSHPTDARGPDVRVPTHARFRTPGGV